MGEGDILRDTKGFRNVVLESDCLEAVDIISEDIPIRIAHILSLINKIRSWLALSWVVNVCFVNIDANIVADFMAKLDGFVDDMEGYLHNLSLEYDSVWDTKPSWCQPWTITLTGVSLITITWFILKSVLVTSLISLLIAAWWFIFLYSYPKAYSEMIAERRKKVTNGVEDTFGVRKKQ
ncbi:unnamed protein product [Lupinus luteus]|uniref:RNase H type-1 domain-containing protein n=1 Tax=Lupinus luteus TaxID=3873 RepID=A0AAV1WM41_LUPLU